MFQNISEEEKNRKDAYETQNIEELNVKDALRKLFTKQNILIYIISFMLSTVSTIGGMSPFALAIFAATLSNGLPAGVVFIITLIGTAIRSWR